MAKNNVLLVGAAGQLGLTIQALWQESALSQQFTLISKTRHDVDITNNESVNKSVEAYHPVAVINASAYTAVDSAETDADSAFQVNEIGAQNLAQACKVFNARLIHISTDFVFDGGGEESRGTPYTPTDITEPTGVYGLSKLAGEKAILETLPANSIIVRTSWLYSEYKSNFVKTMLRLMAQRDSLAVVSDQIGAPTSTHSLAGLLFAIIEKPSVQGVYHWSDAASISWFEFSQGIQKQGLDAGLLDQAIPISPLRTEQYPTPAKRPPYSVLDCSKSITDFGVVQNDWTLELQNIIQRIAEAGE